MRRQEYQLKCLNGMERETGFEPRSVAGSALKPASPAPARAPAPSRLRLASVTPRRGHTPFETPVRGFKVTSTLGLGSKVWIGSRDLRPRPQAWGGTALP